MKNSILSKVFTWFGLGLFVTFLIAYLTEISFFLQEVLKILTLLSFLCKTFTIFAPIKTVST